MKDTSLLEGDMELEKREIDILMFRPCPVCGKKNGVVDLHKACDEELARTVRDRIRYTQLMDKYYPEWRPHE